MQKKTISFDLPNAIRLNNYYQEKLGWIDYIEEIESLILPFSGLENVSLGPEDFACAVYGWQEANGFFGDDLDGIIGTGTWEVMKRKLKLATPSSNPAPGTPVQVAGKPQPANPSEVSGLLTRLGYNMSKLSLQEAIRRFQTDMGGLKVNGTADTSTLARLGELKHKLKYLEQSGISFQRLSRFRFTGYWATHESNYDASSVKVAILDKKGNTLALVPPGFFNDISMEGSGFTMDGKMLNVSGDSVDVSGKPEYTKWVLPDAKKRYPRGGLGLQIDSATGAVTRVHAFETKKAGTFGFGEQRGIPYLPFRTLAADIGIKKWPKHKGIVSPKTKFFVLELAGEKLPDGTIHDGWCTVNDTGGHIYGAHIDIFMGLSKWKNFIPRIGYMIGHVWFKDDKTGETSEKRCPPDYEYGHTD